LIHAESGFLIITETPFFITARADTAFCSYNKERYYNLKLGWFSFSPDKQRKTQLRVFPHTAAELGLEQAAGSATRDSVVNLHHTCCPHRSPAVLRCCSTHLEVSANPALDFLLWNERYQVIEKSLLGVKCFLKEHCLLGCGLTYRYLN